MSTACDNRIVGNTFDDDGVAVRPCDESDAGSTWATRSGTRRRAATTSIAHNTFHGSRSRPATTGTRGVVSAGPVPRTWPPRPAAARLHARGIARRAGRRRRGRRSDPAAAPDTRRHRTRSSRPESGAAARRHHRRRVGPGPWPPPPKLGRLDGQTPRRLRGGCRPAWPPGCCVSFRGGSPSARAGTCPARWTLTPSKGRLRDFDVPAALCRRERLRPTTRPSRPAGPTLSGYARFFAPIDSDRPARPRLRASPGAPATPGRSPRTLAGEPVRTERT